VTESDASLVARARRGDASAFETLIQRHFRGAFLVAMAHLGERSDAEDVCQDAFVRCWERIDDCRDAAKFGAWLLRTVRNTAHNRREYLAVRAVQPLDDADGVASVASPESELDRRELRAVLWNALRQLGDIQREVVLLHDHEGWPHAEVAARLDISELMSRRHLSDARRILRGLLQDDDPRMEAERD
jgi:RNA polymerase sigma-70 factor (ECF subfamily)